MSKAFTRESDDSGKGETPIVRRQLPRGTKNYITREGADRLRQRLTDLVEKKESMRSTTGEGMAAVDAEQRKIESAIRNLQEILDSVVLAEIPVDREKVGFGATVMIRRGCGEEEHYRIVGVEEADPEVGSISWLSPLAKALLTRRAGDRVRFRAAGVEQELTIVSVAY
ncbi:MAG TPA: GreA/GreB family elongation factor [Candidatus Limnocylindrales bacterium]|nr:GreA/GreB family elongation factor [Candidatus Limnocylindrales bacterium]